MSPSPDTLESRVKALGFSVSGMKDYGSYVLVEGDIRLEKSILLKGLAGSTEGAPSPGIRPPDGADYQYSTNTTVSQTYVKQITVDLTNINGVSDWAPAVRTAIAAFNASGSAVYMSEAAPGDITFSSISYSPDYIAQASWPYQGSPSGKPGPTVTVAQNWDHLALNQKEWVMAHELGHTVGLRHDNALALEGSAGIGANLISGTPAQDPNSVMVKYYDYRTWAGFSQYDVYALQFLYPAPSLSVSISGPQYVTRYQSAQYFASVTSGTAPYTYQWRSRQCTDSGGGNCGAWSNWYSTGAQNSTYASINSCGLARNELQAKVTDTQSLTGTSSTYPIWITNPC